MPTLILPPRFNPDTNLVRKAAIEAGWKIERLTSWRVPRHVSGPGLVLYGEPLFAAVVACSLNLALLEPPFDWLTQLTETYLRRDVKFGSLGDARGLVGPLFIKPADDKCFLAKVYGSGDELPDSGVLPDNTPVLTSAPVEWDVEYRCFLLDRTLQAMSPYWRQGKLAQAENGSWPVDVRESQEAAEFIEQILADETVELPPAVVVDIGVIRGRGWAVVESNPAWGSGIYGCDPEQVLPVLERCSIDIDKVSVDDQRWIPKRG